MPIVFDRTATASEITDILVSYSEFAAGCYDLTDEAADILRAHGFSRDNLSHIIRRGPYVDFSLKIEEPFVVSYIVTTLNESETFGADYFDEAIEFAIEKSKSDVLESSKPHSPPNWVIEIKNALQARWHFYGNNYVFDARPRDLKVSAFYRPGEQYKICAKISDAAGDSSATFMLHGTAPGEEILAAVEQREALIELVHNRIDELKESHPHLSPSLRYDFIGATVANDYESIVIRLSASRFDSQEWLLFGKASEVKIFDDFIVAMDYALEQLLGK
jgi:hypothetical protein